MQPSLLALITELTTHLTQHNLQPSPPLVLPSRNAHFAPLPDALHKRIKNQLEESHPNGIYAHQSHAIHLALQGQDLCLATSTASGKSLIFMATAAHFLATQPKARILALYPTRALLADQTHRWNTLLAPYGEQAVLIDGGVPVSERLQLLSQHRVILMTPDVVHAWLLPSNTPETTSFFNHLKLLILDEAHAYEGVFGTNTAYMLRRLTAAAPRYQLIASTATIADPEAHLRTLTGRNCTLIGPESEGSAQPERAMLHATGQANQLASVILDLQKSPTQHYLIFADSRAGVEQLVATMRQKAAPAGIPESALPLPYRSGYEDEDRLRIQQALQSGTLRGVVSTSALELGLDIGDLDLVVLLGVPPSKKAFWQRMGRMGRNRPGVGLLLDLDGQLARMGLTLAEYMAQPVEPIWLYLENRFLQYAQALCFVHECQSRPLPGLKQALEQFPEGFRRFVANEESQTESIPPELLELKQRAEAGPHLEFPLRGSGELSFQVQSHTARLGTLTYDQLLREAYPGALYYYMGEAWRVCYVQHHRQIVTVLRAGAGQTRPQRQVMAFPDFAGAFQTRTGDVGFWSECPLQVSEQVIGFRERRGNNWVTHIYKEAKGYTRRPLSRMVETTGVCWSLGQEATNLAVAEAIAEVFAQHFGVQRADIGVGWMHARETPWGGKEVKGVCIYDAVRGSLRLTSRLADSFEAVVREALRVASEPELRVGLAALRDRFAGLEGWPPVGTAPVVQEAHVVQLIAPGEKAILMPDASEVTILDWRYTPAGVVYQLEHERARHQVPAGRVKAIVGFTRLCWVDLMSGQEVAA